MSSRGGHGSTTEPTGSTGSTGSTGRAVAERELDINELARASGQSVRNLRAYLQMGVLQPGDKRGRSLIFGDEHVRRLREVQRLRDRGYSLAAVRDVLSRSASAASNSPLDEDIDAIANMVARWRAEAQGSARMWPHIDELEDEIEVVLGEHGAELRPALVRAALDVARLGVPVDEVLREFEELGRVLEPVIDHLDTVSRRWSDVDGVNADRLLTRVWPSILVAVCSQITEPGLAQAGELP